MKNIYIAVAIVFVLSIALFTATFAYLDKSKHRLYDYVVTLNGREVGSIRIDRYVTEDKLIYKSVSSMPFYPVFTESLSRLYLNKKHRLENYTKEKASGRAISSLYLENANGLVSFVSRYQSRFAFVDNMPIKRDTFIFEEDSPMTYLPIIENYDFSQGRSQSFYTLTPSLTPDLPPMKRIMTFTSIKDEYIKTDSRKIKTENLIIKTQNHPQASVWVAKSDRAVIKIDLPARGITITRSFRPRNITAKEFTIQDPRYISREVSFKSNNVDISGTMTTPTREGRFPAVLLIGGGMPADRNMQGLFLFLSDHLSKNGFCVLRYDRRGIGASKGDASSSTDKDEIYDALAAFEYLKSQDAVDPEKIFVLGHEKGARYALKLYSEKKQIKAIVLMAPALTPDLDEAKIRERLTKAAAKARWSEDYMDLAMRTARAVEARVRDVEGDWTSILGKRCYLGAIRQDLAEKQIPVITQINIPVLILESSDDRDPTGEAALGLHGSAEEPRDKNHTIKYYGGLGNLFGAPVDDGVNRLHYSTDEAVMEYVKAWLDRMALESSDRKADQPPETAASAPSAPSADTEAEKHSP